MNFSSLHFFGWRTIAGTGLILMAAALTGCGPSAPPPAAGGTKGTAASGSKTNSTAQPTNTLSSAYVSTFEDLPPDKGKDPFYPLSRRRMPAAPVVIPGAPAPVHSDLPPLVLKMISGSAKHRFAVINSETLTTGEKSLVRTPNGKLQVTCREIGEDYVVIAIDGEEGETRLTLAEKK